MERIWRRARSEKAKRKRELLEESSNAETVTMSPKAAAWAMFSTLTNPNIGSPDFVRNIGNLYSSKKDPIYTGNALLSYGQLSTRWFEPDDPNTRRAIQRCLTVFKIKLERDAYDPEEIFVQRLGELTSSFASGDIDIYVPLDS